MISFSRSLGSHTKILIASNNAFDISTPHSPTKENDHYIYHPPTTFATHQEEKVCPFTAIMLFSFFTLITSLCAIGTYHAATNIQTCDRRAFDVQLWTTSNQLLLTYCHPPLKPTNTYLDYGTYSFGTKSNLTVGALVDYFRDEDVWEVPPRETHWVSVPDPFRVAYFAVRGVTFRVVRELLRREWVHWEARSTVFGVEIRELKAGSEKGRKAGSG
jgi:hypothetical protein